MSIANDAKQSRTIEDYLKEYFLDRPCSQHYMEQVHSDVRKFGEHLGRVATLADYTDANVNSFLTHLGTSDRARITVKNMRTRLLAVWRHAFENEWLEELPRRVYKIKTLKIVVQAWDEKELARLLAACDALPGRFMNRWVLPKAKFARAIVTAAYESGARLGDIERWTFDDLDERGSLTWIQHKTGKEHSASFSEATIAAMKAIRREGTDLIFGRCLDRRFFLIWFRALVKSAGLKGTFRWLRRTSGSLIERDNPGCGHKHLGNLPEVFAKHYDAKRITGDHHKRPKPPSISPSSANVAPDPVQRIAADLSQPATFGKWSGWEAEA